MKSIYFVNCVILLSDNFSVQDLAGALASVFFPRCQESLTEDVRRGQHMYIYAKIQIRRRQIFSGPSEVIPALQTHTYRSRNSQACLEHIYIYIEVEKLPSLSETHTCRSRNYQACLKVKHIHIESEKLPGLSETHTYRSRNCQACLKPLFAHFLFSLPRCR